MGYKQELEEVLIGFFRDKEKKSLCILLDSTLNIHPIVALKIKELAVAPLYYFDSSQDTFITSTLEAISKNKQAILIFNFGKNNDLENVYTKYDLLQWSAKCIIICPQRLLHPTLDSSIYFAPIDNGKVQRRLLTQVVLSPPHFSPNFSDKISPLTTAIPVSNNPSMPLAEFHHHFLSQKLMTNNPLMMQLLADKIFEDDEFKNFLFKLIYASRHDEKMQIAAANAITALNYARVSFSGMDLSYIQIPFADLRGAVLHRTNLTGADLRNVRLQNSYLAEAIMCECDLTNAVFEQQPYLTHYALTVTSVTYSPDNKWFAAAGTDETVMIWRMGAGVYDLQHILFGHEDWAECLSFSGNSKFLATGSRDKTLRLWQVEDGVLQRTFYGHTDWVRSVAISHNNELIASGSNDKTVRIWRTSDETLLHTLKGHTDWVNSVAFSGSGDLLVSGGKDGTVRLWSVVKGELHRVLTGHTSIVNSVVFSKDNKWVASAGEDTHVRLWWTNDGSSRATLSGNLYGITSIALSNDDQLLAVCTDYTVWLWRVEDAKVEHILYGQPQFGHIKGSKSVAFSANNQWLATGNADGTIRIWPINNEANQFIHKVHGLNEIECLTFSRDNQNLAAGSWDSTVRFWYVKNSSLQRTLENRNGRVIVVNFLRNNDLAFICSGVEKYRSPNVSPPKFFSVTATNQSLAKIKELSDIPSIYLSAFSPDCQLIATASKDRQHIIMIWGNKDETLKLLHSFDSHSQWITCLAISSDSQLLASGSLDKTIKVWRIGNGHLLYTFTADNECINSIAFSDNGQWLVSGNFNNAIWIYRLYDGVPVRELRDDNYNLVPNPTVWISRLAISYDNRWIAAGNNIGQLRLWSLTEGSLQQVCDLTSGITAVTFSFDNQWLAVGCIDKAIRLYRLQLESNNLRAYLQWITHSRLVAEKTDMQGAKGLNVSSMKLLAQHGALNISQSNNADHLTVFFRQKRNRIKSTQAVDVRLKISRILRWVSIFEPEPGVHELTFDGFTWTERLVTGRIDVFEPVNENETIVVEKYEHRNKGTLVRLLNNVDFELFIPQKNSNQHWIWYRHNKEDWRYLNGAVDVKIAEQENYSVCENKHN